jgi:uracil-DNA glycosylase family 4
MEAHYRQGLNVLVEMLRGLEDHSAFRADISIIERIALLPLPGQDPSPIEETGALEPSQIDKSIPDETPLRITEEARTEEPALGTESFEELRTRVLACTQCPHLVAFRHSVVFGVGNPKAEVMFVGEAPGADEDMQGEPFVGRAGELLTKIIQTMGYERSEVYIANVLKCRPDIPPGTPGNRQPTPIEMATCLPYLRQQIDLIQPKLMVALGATAMRGLFGTDEPMRQMRGRWHQFGPIPVMATFHPSYLLRNQALSLKRQVWEDMLQVLERLGHPISERQKNYFLPR